MSLVGSLSTLSSQIVSLVGSLSTLSSQIGSLSTLWDQLVSLIGPLSTLWGQPVSLIGPLSTLWGQLVSLVGPLSTLSSHIGSLIAPLSTLSNQMVSLIEPLCLWSSRYLHYQASVCFRWGPSGWVTSPDRQANRWMWNQNDPVKTASVLSLILYLGIFYFETWSWSCAERLEVVIEWRTGGACRVGWWVEGWSEREERGRQRHIETHKRDLATERVGQRQKQGQARGERESIWMRQTETHRKRGEKAKIQPWIMWTSIRICIPVKPLPATDRIAFSDYKSAMQKTVNCPCEWHKNQSRLFALSSRRGRTKGGWCLKND